MFKIATPDAPVKKQSKYWSTNYCNGEDHCDWRATKEKKPKTIRNNGSIEN